MPMSSMIEVELGGYRVPVYIHEREVITSPHTGRDLRVLRGEVRATGEELHEQFTELLGDDDPVVWSTEVPGASRERWRLHRESYSIAAEKYRYQVTLTENEELSITALVLDGLELPPLSYEESVRRGILEIRAVVMVEGALQDGLQKLLRKPDYFQVIRRGISDTPVTMRFGLHGWSQHENRRKYNLLLVAKEYDEGVDERRPSIVESREVAVRDSVAVQIALARELLSAFVQKGVLSETEVAEIKKGALDRAADVRDEFLRVNDAEHLG